METIQPDAYVAVRLPSDTLKVLKVVPNTYVSDKALVSSLIYNIAT